MFQNAVHPRAAGAATQALACLVESSAGAVEVWSRRAQGSLASTDDAVPGSKMPLAIQLIYMASDGSQRTGVVIPSAATIRAVKFMTLQ